MEKPGRALQTLNIVSAVLVLIGLGLVFFYAPEEQVMGQVQRIFYFHVASAWVGMLAFVITFVAGVIYLVTSKPIWDRVGYASVEVGLLFSVSAGVAGAIWARPIWNTWWTWDPRLTTYTIMALVYVAYLMLRQGIEDPDRRARFAAVYGIVGVISVPITYFSIRWWRTIHPVVIGNASDTAKGTFAMTPPMLQTFLFSLLAFTVLYCCFLFNRLRLARLEDRVEKLKAELSAALKEAAMSALFLTDPTPDTVGYLIAGYVFLLGLPLLYILSWFTRQRSLKRDLDTIESLAADERKQSAAPPASSPSRPAGETGQPRWQPPAMALAPSEPALIKGMHGLFYTPEAEALRVWLRDVLGFPFTDTGGGWLIFDMPAADLGVHPAGRQYHELSFYCDDLPATIAELLGRGAEFVGGISEQDWGFHTRARAPGGLEILLYQPKYQK